MLAEYLDQQLFCSLIIDFLCMTARYMIQLFDTRKGCVLLLIIFVRWYLEFRINIKNIQQYVLSIYTCQQMFTSGYTDVKLAIIRMDAYCLQFIFMPFLIAWPGVRELSIVRAVMLAFLTIYSTSDTGLPCRLSSTCTSSFYIPGCSITIGCKDRDRVHSSALISYVSSLYPTWLLSRLLI